MDEIRDLDTPAARIAFAIERSEMTLESLAAKIGCSHAALSQWRSGKTDASHIKAGLLQAFADATNTDVRWLLTGKGPVVSRYVLTAEMTRLGSALAVMERTAPPKSRPSSRWSKRQPSHSPTDRYPPPHLGKAAVKLRTPP